MRICIRCKRRKRIIDFNFKNKKLGIKDKACKECTRLAVRRHYYLNKKYYLAKARKRNKLIRIQIKFFIKNYLIEHPCIDCGESNPIVLEFDHIGEKKFTISTSSRSQTLALVKAEIAKCVIRCANCHRRKTAHQFGWHKKYMPL